VNGNNARNSRENDRWQKYNMGQGGIKGTQRCQLCLYTHVKGCHADCQEFQERRPFYKTILLLSPDDDHAVGRQRTVDLEFSILRRQGANGIEIKDM